MSSWQPASSSTGALRLLHEGMEDIKGYREFRFEEATNLATTFAISDEAPREVPQSSAREPGVSADRPLRGAAIKSL